MIPPVPFPMHHIPLPKGVRVGFYGRQGGYSKGRFASLNCDPRQDDPQIVEKNRQAILTTMAPGSVLYTLNQVHGTNVHVIEPGTPPHPMEGDGLVTRHKSIALGILTADCAPVILIDDTGVIGAMHCGWRSAFGGIVDTTVKNMINLGATPDRIQAIIGPCIAKESYKVDQTYQNAFTTENPAFINYFTSLSNGDILFDLRAFVENRLNNAGIKAIYHVMADTATDDHLFSYRRAMIESHGITGRQLSLISLI